MHPCRHPGRQAGLVDNISEYNDVIELYRMQVGELRKPESVVIPSL